MPSLLTDREYADAFRAAGFHGTRIEDWTHHVRPSLARIGRIATAAQPFLTPALKLGVINEAQRGNGRASYAQVRALRRGLWRYLVITGRRPAV